MMYLYPENLRSKATLGLWELKDIMITGGVLVPGILIYAKTGIMLFAIGAAVYAFLSIKIDDTSIVDFIKYAAAYFITDQQKYEWRRRDVKR